jgi:XTP/dITP diphosphohydrolase
MTRKFTGTELVIATHNNGKMDELRDMFNGMGIKLISSAELGLPVPVETGTTFIENSTIKALETAQATGKVCLADDSGLCVDALNGDPGVYSADWSEVGDTRDFKIGMKKIHDAMGDNPNKKAHFVSVLTLCWPDGHCEHVEGVAHGVIVNPMRGIEGHGYDPIFQPDGYTQTYAELDTDEKNRISHRADSFRKMFKQNF